MSNDKVIELAQKIVNVMDSESSVAMWANEIIALLRAQAPSQASEGAERPQMPEDFWAGTNPAATKYYQQLEAYCDALSAEAAKLREEKAMWKELAEVAQRHLIPQVIENELHEARAKLREMGEL